MLDGLDAINWAALTHAYGSAADVPDLLRALASEDDVERFDAMYDLHGSIWHQGTVYPATAAAAPFLYELLADPEVQGKSEIARIAAGSGFLEVHAVDDDAEEIWGGILAEKGESLDRAMEREAAQIRTVRQAAAAGLLDLVPYLYDADPQNRFAVAEALGQYPEHAPVTLPELRNVVLLESDEDVRVVLNESIRQLETAST